MRDAIENSIREFTVHYNQALQYQENYDGVGLGCLSRMLLL